MSPGGRWDAIVVGAGPAGSASAIGLRRAGLHVVVLDARRFPRSKPCGDALSPGATPLLRALGVWDGLRARDSAPVDGWRVHATDGTWFECLYRPRRRGTPAEGLCVERATLDRALLDAARFEGAEVREAVRVFGLLRRGGRVVGVRARGPSGDVMELESGFVIGADGLRSRVARELGGVRHGRRRRLGLVGRWEGTGVARRVGELRVARDGVVGLAPLGAGRANVTVVVPMDLAPALAPDPTPFFLDRVEAAGLAARLEGARLSRPIEVTGPFEVTPARLSAPGALLVGDAAGYLDPFTGQGVFRALDGATLAVAAVRAALRASSADEPSVLRAYERSLARRLRLSRAVQRGIDVVVGRPGLIDPAARILRTQPRIAGLIADITGDRTRASLPSRARAPGIR